MALKVGGFDCSIGGFTVVERAMSFSRNVMVRSSLRVDKENYMINGKETLRGG